MARTRHFPGRYDYLAQICEFVAESAAEAGLDEMESSRCQLAVDEACTNIIEHGYGGEDRGQIGVTCEVVPGQLTITLQDSARRFDPDGVPQPNLNAPVDEMKIGGLGLYFMRQVMDAVQFSYDGGGNRLVLIKRKS